MDLPRECVFFVCGQSEGLGRQQFCDPSGRDERGERVVSSNCVHCLGTHRLGTSTHCSTGSRLFGSFLDDFGKTFKTKSTCQVSQRGAFAATCVEVKLVGVHLRQLATTCICLKLDGGHPRPFRSLHTHGRHLINEISIKLSSGGKTDSARASEAVEILVFAILCHSYVAL